jgi:hypothetical protein
MTAKYPMSKYTKQGDFSTPTGECKDSTLIRAMNILFHGLFNFSFINRPNIRRCIAWATECVAN